MDFTVKLISIAFSSERDLEVQLPFGFWDGTRDLVSSIAVQGTPAFSAEDVGKKLEIVNGELKGREGKTAVTNPWQVIWRDAKYPEACLLGIITKVEPK